MSKKTQNLLWLGLIFSIALALLWQFYPLPDARQKMDSLPLSGKHFIGKNEALNPFETSFFKGVNIIKRNYSINGQSYFITILDGTHNRHLVHDPYYCFKGMGWDVLNEKSIPILHGYANLITIAKDKKKKDAMYWFTNGTSTYTSPLKYWWQTTLRRLTLGYSGPEPVLIMIQPITGSSIDGKELEQAFPELFNL